MTNWTARRTREDQMHMAAKAILELIMAFMGVRSI
eukprot:COSAG01_NODE_69203_length_262_cov_0.601227_1_plen_34_part_10